MKVRLGVTSSKAVVKIVAILGKTNNKNIKQNHDAKQSQEQMHIGNKNNQHKAQEWRKWSGEETYSFIIHIDPKPPSMGIGIYERSFLVTKGRFSHK